MSVQKSKTLSQNEQSKVLWRSLARIQEKWGLNDTELAQLLHVNKATLSRWREAEETPVRSDKVKDEVLSNFIAVFRSLGAMFQNPGDQKIWLTSPHMDFGASPFELMIQSVAGLFYVRSYLDYIRGRGA